eukprot:scaffold93381_cov63-Phaeocystis_antarctica.AAC.4
MFARRPEVGFAHKEKLSYEQRCYESTRVREKYSDRFPVIVERDGNSDVPAVDKCATTHAREMSRASTLSSACTSRKRALTARYPRWPHAIHMLSTLPTRPLHRCKYLIPHDMTMGQLVYVLRKRIAVPAEQAIFVFVGNTLPPATALVSNVVRAAPALAH